MKRDIHLVQLLLPLRDRHRRRLPGRCYADVARELTERFGGLTAYTRAPAAGLWRPHRRAGTTEASPAVRDDIVVYEVMSRHLDARWWARYRRTLEARFGQDEVVVRAQPMRRL